MNKRSKIATVALAACMTTSVALVAAGCGGVADPKGYTYRTATTGLATNWNPHAWETNVDSELLTYLTSPFVDMTILDSEERTFQWVYEMATSVEDVTKDHKDDLTKYGVRLQKGKTAETTEAGFVFEIKLNQNAKWENGEQITADDYIYSMQQLLNPEMKNYRANLYIADESELAGAYNYYYSTDASIFLDTARLVEVDDKGNITRLNFATNEEAIAAGWKITLDMWSFYGLQGMKDANGKECPQYVSITDTTKYRDEAVEDESAEGAWVSAADLYAKYIDDMQVGGDYSTYVGVFYEKNPYNGMKFADGVGLYKVDDYTIRYVNNVYIELNTFMTSLTSNWLVYEGLYEAGKETTGALTTTTYGTSLETTMSYGVYKFESYDEGRQMKFEQNENWYGWDKDENGDLVVDENGNLVSHTSVKINGQNVRQYMTTNIIIDVMDTATQEQAFMNGELTTWTPASDQLSTYEMSDFLYQEDETYTMSFFFNTNEKVLTELGKEDKNKNCIVVSNTNFRKAMSLAINRDEYVTATPGYKPAYSLMNELYYYDIYNDQNSVYRNTDEAMEAICKLYGVEYGADKTYKTLEEAYNSINGYNLTEAKALMKQACDELVAAGKYKSGEPINIAIAWKFGAQNSDDQAQLALLNKYINAAAEGSGFGTITFSQTCNMQDPDPYTAVPQGLYAIGQGAWGGAFLYPFRNFQVYMDSSKYSINEAGCWDPATETITLEVPKVDANGQAIAGETEKVTMSWKSWSNSMSGSGRYAAASNEVKLAITALLEEAYLGKYFRIPISGMVVSYLLSQQVSYYTENYHVLYGFGGLRLMTYNYTNGEFADLAKDGLSYE